MLGQVSIDWTHLSVIGCGVVGSWGVVKVGGGEWWGLLMSERSGLGCVLSDGG